MTFGYGNCGFTCESQCPPHHVCIQPPPFVITVPGPVMSCSDDSCAVAYDAPCCGYGGWGGLGGWGGYGGSGGYGGWGGCGGWGGRGWGGYGGCYGGYGGWGNFGGWGGRRFGSCGW